jgi:hypothetical protein
MEASLTTEQKRQSNHLLPEDMHRYIRIYAAYAGVMPSQIVERAVREFRERNPIPAKSA